MNAEQILDGTIIRDGCILNQDYFAILAEEDIGEDYDQYDNRPAMHLAVYNLSLPEGERWGVLSFQANAWHNPCLCHTRENELIMADQQNRVYYLGVGENKTFEQSIEKKLAVGIDRLKNLFGDVYAIGFPRAILKRLGTNQWESLSGELRTLRASEIQEGTEVGFLDMDGFNNADIYAVGGEKDIWHYDGTVWTPIDVCDGRFLPKAVCCSDDGYVYIVGAWGMVVKGRGDHWHAYRPKELGDTLHSVIEYQGRIYVGSEYQTYLLDTQQLTLAKYNFENQITPIGGWRFYKAYGWLMVVSPFAAAIYDGLQWQILYNSRFEEKAAEAVPL